MPDMPHMLPRSQSFSGCIPVRLDGNPKKGPLAGVGMWRGVKDFEHATLCRAFGLDQARFYFDMPSTVRGVGSNSRGFDPSSGRRRLINGFVMMAGCNEPVGKLTIVSSFDKFRDVDPTSEKDFYDLSSS